MARELKVRRAVEALSETVDYRAPLDFWRGRLEDARTLFTLEMVRIPVDKFIDAKSGPTNTDLKAIFDRYKGVMAPILKTASSGFPKTSRYRGVEYASIPSDKSARDQATVTDEGMQKITTREERVPRRTADRATARPRPRQGCGERRGKGGCAEDRRSCSSQEGGKEAEPPKTQSRKESPSAKPAPTAKKTGAVPSLDLLRTVVATSLYVSSGRKEARREEACRQGNCTCEIRTERHRREAQQTKNASTLKSLSDTAGQRGSQSYCLHPMMWEAPTKITSETVPVKT